MLRILEHSPGYRILVTIVQYREHMSKKQHLMTQRARSRKAFAMGFSGVGMLLTKAIELHALQRGETLDQAWSHVGRYLDRASVKQIDERRKAAG